LDTLLGIKPEWWAVIISGLALLVTCIGFIIKILKKGKKKNNYKMR